MNDDIWAKVLNARWYSPGEYTIPTDIASWLQESDSMTQRLAQYCKKISVIPTFEGFISQADISAEKTVLPTSSRYWLRDVVLYGDDIPWLRGRTVLPEETLTGDECSLMNLGCTPLGHYLFNHADLTRDFIQIQQQSQLWARRSRLCLSGKPLLLTELFLPAAPLYDHRNIN